MFIAAIKVFETAFRAVFVLLVLYSLPARQAGQFGLILTLIGFFSFLAGFERYCDLQRVMIGKTENTLNAVILTTLHFFCVNYVLWLPILAILLFTWVKLSFGLVLLCTWIAVAEHLSNEGYRVVVVTNKYRALLIVSVFKNMLLVVCLIIVKMTDTLSYGFEEWLLLWAVSSLPMMILMGNFWNNQVKKTGVLKPADRLSIRDQYGHSVVHFRIGLLALLSLQADRLIAGKMLPLELLGDYFKNILCVTAIYQLLGIISHNRLMPVVYGLVRSGQCHQAKKIIEKQIFFNGLLIIVLGFSWFIFLNYWSGYFNTQGIQLSYCGILLLACFIRGIADYKAMILNAAFQERSIYHAQGFSLIFCLPCSILLAWLFGFSGLIFSVLLYAAAYLLIIYQIKMVPGLIDANTAS